MKKQHDAHMEAFEEHLHDTDCAAWERYLNGELNGQPEIDEWSGVEELQIIS